MPNRLRVLYSSFRDSDSVYATRVNVHDPFYYFEFDDKRVAFLDNRDYDHFKDHARAGIETILLDDDLMARYKKLRQERAEVMPGVVMGMLYMDVLKERYGFESKELEVNDQFPLALADAFREQGYTVTIASPFFQGRLLKDDADIAAMREANKKANAAFEFIQEVLRASTIDGTTIRYKGAVLTSEWLRREVEVLYLRLGMSLPEGLIIASGPQAAQPHNQGSGPILPHETIICDIFPKDMETGYYADITRTYFKGEPKPEVRTMYGKVLEVQEAQLAMLGPGVNAADVHRRGVEMFKEAGYHVAASYGFCHSTGHGLGLDIHDPSSGCLRVADMSDLVFAPGHVVTIEPGLYYQEKGWGGVRIEDDIVITADGYENLTHLDKALQVF